MFSGLRVAGSYPKVLVTTGFNGWLGGAAAEQAASFRHDILRRLLELNLPRCIDHKNNTSNKNNLIFIPVLISADE